MARNLDISKVQHKHNNYSCKYNSGIVVKKPTTSEDGEIYC